MLRTYLRNFKALQRAGLELRGEKGWGFTGAGNLYGMWVDAAPPGTILQADLKLFMHLEERKYQELLK